MSGRTDRRNILLAAAARVVRTQGAAALTLEAVAQAAGTSKGGLLYHFPTKNALIAAMLADELARFEREVERLERDDSRHGRGSWLRAFVRATFALTPAEAGFNAALLAAATADPAMLTPLREAFARWQARAVEDGLDPATATLVRLAADGLWFADLFAAGAPEGALRAEVLVRLLQFTENSARDAT